MPISEMMKLRTITIKEYNKHRNADQDHPVLRSEFQVIVYGLARLLIYGDQPTLDVDVHKRSKSWVLSITQFAQKGL